MVRAKAAWNFNNHAALLGSAGQALPGRLMAGQRPLEPSVEVRILSRQHERRME
jgi:hypothetical protein